MTVYGATANGWGPIDPPTPVQGKPLTAIEYEVVTVNADGTVDVRSRSSRASRIGVPVPPGTVLAIGDRVVIVDLGADQQLPVIVQVTQSQLVADSRWTTGDLKATGLPTAGPTWRLADGAALTATDTPAAALRAALIAAGNPHGVSGVDPLLPDLRGRVPLGAGSGPGLTARTLGQKLGAETVPHTHHVDPTANVLVNAGSATGVWVNNGTVNTQGASDTNNMPPATAVFWHIKL